MRRFTFATALLFTTASRLFAADTAFEERRALRGALAEAFYAVLGVAATGPTDNPGDRGINWLEGRKNFESSDRSFKAYCEDRAFSTSCTLGVGRLQAQAAREFYEVLDVEEQPVEDIGYNRLLGRKVFSITDEGSKLLVSCSRRVANVDCVVRVD